MRGPALRLRRHTRHAHARLSPRLIRRAPDDVRAWRRELRTLARVDTSRYAYAVPVPAMRRAYRVPLVWRREARQP